MDEAVSHGRSQVPITAIIVQPLLSPRAGLGSLVLASSSSSRSQLTDTQSQLHSSPESSRITATSESSESILSQTHHVNCASIIIRADVYISSILNSCIVHVGVTDDVQILATVSLAGLFLLLRSYSSRFPQSRWRP